MSATECAANTIFDSSCSRHAVGFGAGAIGANGNAGA